MTAGPSDVERVRTVFLGSGSFGAPALRRLAAHPCVELVGIVTAPTRPVGRRQVPTPTPIGALALELGLAPLLTPARLRAPGAVEAVLALRPGLVVLADYGQIVPPALLDLPHGALNLHPSALPRWRGASPVPATILAGDAITAVTLMRMDVGLDTGPIVAQAPVSLLGHETAPDLEARLAVVAAELLAASLDPWLDGTLVARPQPAEGMTITRPLRREDGRLDPSVPAAALERRVRAFLPWPGTFLESDGERLVVTAASVAPSEPGDVPGSVVPHGDRPALATADGRLVLDAVTPPGRRPMSGADYLRGRRRPA
ncbi:MAG TPA: methionyl-tRNA formyltransferase [Candidatus Limnocylindrales bacterium]